MNLINNGINGILMLASFRLKLFAICLLPACVSAQLQDVDGLIDMSLEELMQVQVYTASRSHESLDTAPSTIYVVTEKDILANGYFSLKDVLENTPGVVPIDTGFFLFGGQRGLLGNFSQTLIMIDGREMQNLLAAETFISHQFTTHNVKQIEIINGPGSALYGANAYVGVINIITKHGSKDFEAVELQLETGSNNTNAYSLTFAKTFGDLRLSGSARVYKSDNEDFSEFVNDTGKFSEGLSPVLQTGNNALTPGEGYLNYSESTPLSFKIDFKEVYFGLESYSLQSGKGLENVALDYNAQRDYREFELQYLGWHHDFSKKTNINVEFQTYVERLWGINYKADQAIFDALVTGGRNPGLPITQQEIQDNFLEYYSQENSSGSKRHRLDVQLESIVNDWNVIAGYTFDQLDILGVAISRIDASPPFDETRSFSNALRRPFYKTDKHSLYAQFKKTFLSEKLHLTLGGRIDNQDIYGSIETVRGGLVYEYSEATYYKLLYGEAFREPNIFEQGASNDPGKAFNDSLEPAKIETFELAVNHRFSNQIKSNMVIYYSTVKNFLEPASTVDFVNSNKEENAKGLEAQLFYNYEDLSGDVMYTFTDPENRIVAGVEIDALNNYKHRLSLGINYDVVPHLKLNTRVNYFDSMQAEHGNSDLEQVINIPSSMRLDFTVSVDEFNYNGLHISLMTSIKNVTDEVQYQPNVRNGGPKQFLQPGRNYQAKLQFKFN
jgi:outer membrane cobalamin receptor